jgi:predicted TIM-barrel fold metal-dependent hydrolase
LLPGQRPVPALRIVIDHFGWPAAGPGGGDLAGHIHRLARLAAAGNVATRIDAIFSGFPGDERAMLFDRTAERWYAQRDR